MFKERKYFRGFVEWGEELRGYGGPALGWGVDDDVGLEMDVLEEGVVGYHGFYCCFLGVGRHFDFWS